MKLSTDEFLAKAAELLEKNAGKSSIYITQKRLSHSADSEIEGALFDDLHHDSHTTVVKAPASTKEYPVLIRITDGAKDKKKKVKLSTVVEVDQLDKFWNDYSNVLKSGFVGLKKKSKKSKKKKAKRAAKKVAAN